MYIGNARFPILNQDQTNPALSGYSRSLDRGTKNMQLQKARALLPFAAPQAAAQLQQQQLNNQGLQATLPYKGPQAAAQLQGEQLKNAFQAVLNQYLPQQQQAEIGQKGAMANFYNMGGGRGGVEGQSQQQVRQLIGVMNPQLKGDVNKIIEAENQYYAGKNKLADGTKLAPMTTTLQQALSTAEYHSTPAALLTQQMKANQSEAALDSIQSMAQDDMAPYGRTVLGISPLAFKDSLEYNDGSQKYKDTQTRLGNFMAANAIQFEQALLRTAMSGGPAGIKAVNELMKESRQYIDQNYPTMSPEARLAANKRLNQYFKKIIDARNSIGSSVAIIPQLQQQAQNYSADNDPLGLR